MYIVCFHCFQKLQFPRYATMFILAFSYIISIFNMDADFRDRKLEILFYVDLVFYSFLYC
jgi:hypothetical protein